MLCKSSKQRKKLGYEAFYIIVNQSQNSGVPWLSYLARVDIKMQEEFPLQVIKYARAVGQKNPKIGLVSCGVLFYNGGHCAIKYRCRLRELPILSARQHIILRSHDIPHVTKTFRSITLVRIE